MADHAVDISHADRDVHFRVAHGTLTLRPTSAGHRLLDYLVDEGHRRQGRGEALVRAACRWADDNRAVLLCTRPGDDVLRVLRGHRFFEDRGIWWRYPIPPVPPSGPLPPPF